MVATGLRDHADLHFVHEHVCVCSATFNTQIVCATLRGNCCGYCTSAPARSEALWCTVLQRVCCGINVDSMLKRDESHVSLRLCSTADIRMQAWLGWSSHRGASRSCTWGPALLIQNMLGGRMGTDPGCEARHRMGVTDPGGYPPHGHGFSDRCWWTGWLWK